MTTPRIVICDDEMLIRLWLVERLAEAGYRTEGAEDGAALLATLAREPADLVILDLRLPDASGIDLLTRIRADDPGLPVIMMTAYGEVETAVAAVRAGAFHFLEKPVVLEELCLLIGKALAEHELHTAVARLREGHRWQFGNVELVGRSEAMREVADLVARIAGRETPVNVLITGESGTGKGVVARAIHAQGRREPHPFLSINSASLPEHLLEGELFGHEPGAYTDARQVKRGLVEIADRGTLFLDEIGDLPLSLQSHLLDFLESHRFRRVGGTKSLEVDVHLIAATNRDLEAAVAAGTFREDLFFRLHVVPIVVPPLRDRPEDIAPLAHHFLATLAGELRVPPRTLSAAALEAMERYPWPGNARELRNMLERILLLVDEDPIAVHHLPPNVGAAVGNNRGSTEFVLPTAGLDLEAFERDCLCQAMARTRGNKTAAARLLGLTRDTLRYRLEKYGIT